MHMSETRRDLFRAGGGGLLSHRRLMGMCRWMRSHFRDWIDYNGVADDLTFGVRQFFVFTVSKGSRMFVLKVRSSVFHSI